MIQRIDHIVITTNHVEECLAFYQKLGFAVSRNGDRHELRAGDFKINIHTLGKELSPHATNIQLGSVDVCMEIDESLDEFLSSVAKQGLTSFSGIVNRHGARGNMRSAYFRDPDGNLLEFCEYEK